jgi:hypothetical protein
VSTSVFVTFRFHLDDMDLFFPLAHQTSSGFDDLWRQVFKKRTAARNPKRLDASDRWAVD